MRRDHTHSINRQLVRGALLLLFSGLSGMTASLSQAENLPQERTLPADLAMQAAHAAVEQCKADGYAVSAAVVDRHGLIRAHLRGDGAGPHTLDSSRKKAYTAASLRRPTGELADLIAKIPSLQALRDMNGQILILGGGLPLVLAGEVVGGIGVGGAPGVQLDEACSRAGLKAIGAGQDQTPAAR